MIRYVVYNENSGRYLRTKAHGIKMFTLHLQNAHVFRRRGDAVQSLRNYPQGEYNERNFKIIPIKLEEAK